MINLVLNKRTIKAKSQVFQESRGGRRLYYLLGCASLSAWKTFLTARGGKNERGKEFRQTHKEKEIDYILG
jgi:hypothetical protein